MSHWTTLSSRNLGSAGYPVVTEEAVIAYLRNCDREELLTVLAKVGGYWPGPAMATEESEDLRWCDRRGGEIRLLLTGFRQKKIAAIKMVRALTGLGLREAKEAVETASPNRPFLLKEGWFRPEELERTLDDLKEATCIVEVEGL